MTSELPCNDVVLFKLSWMYAMLVLVVCTPADSSWDMVVMIDCTASPVRIAASVATPASVRTLLTCRRASNDVSTSTCPPKVMLAVVASCWPILSRSVYNLPRAFTACVNSRARVPFLCSADGDSVSFHAFNRLDVCPIPTKALKNKKGKDESMVVKQCRNLP